MVMEERINIVEILKNKPKGTKLYADAFGELSIEDIYAEGKDELGITLSSKDGDELLFYNDGKYNIYGEPILVPSKEMRDWEKFAWKRGDVLVNSRGLKILFDRWANDNYTSFYAKTINLVEDGFLDTNLHTLVSEKEAKSFIKCIEEKLGGKLNRETLEIEKTQPEFKDGDIVALVVRKCTHIAIFQSRQEAYIGFHAVLCQNDELLLEKPFREDVGDIELRLATDSEKQQLFDALAKEGKAWDSEKKIIVELKPKVELKPFDKVLVRQRETEEWRANIFSHIYKTDEYLDYVCIHGTWKFSIPYDGNEQLLGTTKDVED